MTPGDESVEAAVAAMKAGGIVLVVDDEDRENEGDLIMGAEFATTESVAFFLQHTSGFLCVAMDGKRIDELELPLMVSHNTEAQKTAFTVTVDKRVGITTGISASDRADTIACLAKAETEANDLARPGHVLVLRARDGGVLKRAGHTEAGVDLATLAGISTAALLCEVVTDDKTGMARGPALEVLAREHGLPGVTIADLIRYRRRVDRLVTRGSDVRMPTQFGDFRMISFTSKLDGQTHLAMVKGEPAGKDNVLVRVHSECLTGDIFGSRRCDCGEQLHASLNKIAEEGEGVVVYLRGQEGRGIGIAHKLEAYQLQDNGLDTVDANVALGLPVDSREYGVGAQILADLGITTMRLMTNNPAKRAGLQGFGLDVVERVPLQSTPNSDNIAYLRTKRDRMGHLFNDDPTNEESTDDHAL